MGSSVRTDAAPVASTPGASRPPARASRQRTWHRLEVVVPASCADDVGALAFELGSCGVQAEESGERTRLQLYFEGHLDGEALGRQLTEGLRSAGLESAAVGHCLEPERDWNEAWREHYRPQWATDRIVVHPPWLPVDAGPGQLAICIDPAQAFGTGGHESTQLALQALQETDCRDRRCLDVGTGSGVLTIAAVFLGAAHVTAIDIDPVAADNARWNIDGNLGGDARRARVVHGGVEAVAGASFDVVVANLESHLVRPHLARLVALLAPEGRALFSGLVEGERERFLAWLEEAGLRVGPTWSRRGWFSVSASPARGGGCRPSS